MSVSAKSVEINDFDFLAAVVGKSLMILFLMLSMLISSICATHVATPTVTHVESRGGLDRVHMHGINSVYGRVKDVKALLDRRFMCNAL